MLRQIELNEFIHPKILCKVYAVANFLSQVIFGFLLFLGIIRCANEVKTKETKNYQRNKKINCNICITLFTDDHRTWLNTEFLGKISDFSRTKIILPRTSFPCNLTWNEMK